MMEPAPMTGPRLATLVRGGETFIGQETGVAENPGLRYPAKVHVTFVPIPAARSIQTPGAPPEVQMQIVAVPILLPVAFMPLNDGERLAPIGGEDRDYVPAADIIAKYLHVVTDALKQTDVVRAARARFVTR